MLCLEKIALDASDITAIIAALVAGLSALHARWAWCEARRSNEIALHGHRKEIFDAFFDLKIHMIQKAEFASMENVSRFHYSSRDAAFYFEEELANKISEYFDLCFKVADLARVKPDLSKEENSQVSTALKKSHGLATEIEKAIKKVIDQSIKNG